MLPRSRLAEEGAGNKKAEMCKNAKIPFEIFV